MGTRGVGLRAAVVAAVSGAMVVPLWALPPQSAAGVAALMHATALLVTLVIIGRAARTGDAAMRRPRWFLVAALGATSIGALLSAVYVAVAGAVPIPSIVDVFTTAWAPLAAYAFWLVPMRSGSSRGTARLLADAAVAATALFFASWIMVMEPLAASGRWTALGQVVQFANPVLDVFIAAMVLSLLPRARADLRQFLNCVAAGLLLVTLSDSGAALSLAQHGVARFGWPDVTLQAGMGLLALAGLVPASPLLEHAPIASAMDRNLAYLPVAFAVGVGIWQSAFVTEINLGEALLCALMILAIVVRQMVYMRELGIVAEANHHASTHDALTGLANRKAFFARLTEHVATPGSAGAAVLLIDLDGFKEVNDTLGHEAGDEVLIGYAARLRGAAPGQLVARLGGDEFAIFLVAEVDDATSAQVERAAVSLAGDFVTLRPAATTTGLLNVAASIGIAVLRPRDTPVSLLRRADLAMYSAKRSSVSQLAVYRDGMADEVDRRHLLKAALAGALYRDEMRLVYQPLYRLNDGNLAGAETLLRWTSPLLGVVPPDEFIPLAEDSGEIGRIGLWVLEQSVAQMARWEQQGSYLPRLFVNVSAAQFTDELPAQVARILASQGLSPERLTLEITESQLPGLGVNRSMQALRESGVQIALDDFGTGYSSLAPLARLPVDVVKIDRDFIRNLGEHAGRPVMDAVIQLAKALGLTTVAEGIEDVGQAAEASNAGIDIAQGYLFSHPLTAEDLARRLPRTAPPGSSPASGREANGGSHETSAARPSRFPVPRRAREPLPSAYSDLPNDSTE